MSLRALLLALLPLLLAACASTGGGARPGAPAAASASPSPASPAAPKSRQSPYAPAQEDPSKRGDYVAGGLFRPGVPDSVPDDIPDVDAIPEPDVRDEPRARTGNRDYVVLGKQYRVLDDHEGYDEEGGASYYGKKFHGRRTSSGEVYDMYAFTAAHKTLPLPSYARVTNLDNGKTVVVRINDRGPFHKGRIIDLSYAAAVKLGYRDKGTARVRVEALSPESGPLPEPGAADAIAVAQTAPAAASDTAMDKLVQALPAPTATALPAVASGPLAPAAGPTPATGPDAGLPGQVLLQVASFGNQRNAEHALSRLRDAAIAGAQLQDASVNGRKIWRLRIGPVAASAASELAARIAGLGFGLPQRVGN